MSALHQLFGMYFFLHEISNLTRLFCTLRYLITCSSSEVDFGNLDAPWSKDEFFKAFFECTIHLGNMPMSCGERPRSTSTAKIKYFLHIAWCMFLHSMKLSLALNAFGSKSMSCRAEIYAHLLNKWLHLSPWLCIRLGIIDQGRSLTVRKRSSQKHNLGLEYAETRAAFVQPRCFSLRMIFFITTCNYHYAPTLSPWHFLSLAIVALELKTTRSYPQSWHVQIAADMV